MVKNTKTIFRITTAAMCLLWLSACDCTKMILNDNNGLRWPDFLRDWAADYEINDAQRLAIFGQIDTLYRLVEDSTSDSELL